MRFFERALLLVLVGLCGVAGARFSDDAWKQAAPVYDSIVNHPFNRDLESGSLSKERFEYYMAQDALYLPEYSKALTALAAKLENAAEAKKLLLAAIECLEEIRPAGVQAKAEMAPAARMYADFLLATAAYKSREELAAALLPCYWVYLRLARAMRKPDPKNPYKSWIETYSSQKYEKAVEDFRRLTDELAAKASAPLRSKMLQSFVTSARMEWYFWDAAYRLEKWKP